MMGVMHGKITGDHSNSLSFELRVVEVDSKILDGGLLALKSSFETHLISSESLHILCQNSNSLDMQCVFLSQSFTDGRLAG